MQAADKHMEWELIARYLSGEATPEEQQQVDANVLSDPIVAQQVNDARQCWDLSGDALMCENIDTEAALHRVMTQVNLPQPAVNNAPVQQFKISRVVLMHKPWVISMAAAVMLLLGWAAMQLWLGDDKTITFTQTIAMNQPIDNIVLSDGSNVSINGGTKLTYPQDFEGDQRNVTLAGEAYFKVAANKEKPFVIDAGDIQVTVVGTAFNVKAYPDDERLVVVVDEGIVDVTGSNGVVRVTPGYQAIFDKKSGRLEKMLNQNDNYLSWKTGKLTFKEMQLNQVVETLEEIYRINVTVAHDNINARRFTATFQDASSEEVIQVICRTLGLSYTQTTEGFLLSANE